MTHFFHKKFQLIYILLAFFIGISLPSLVHFVFAQQVAIIYACVKNSTGSVRIVSSTTTCASSETALNWNQQGIQGLQGIQGSPGATGSGYFGLPFICDSCHTLALFADKFAGKDFSNADLEGANLSGANIQGVILRGGYLPSVVFNNANLTNADLSNLAVAPDGGLGGSSIDFTNANATNANFSNDKLQSSNFSNANLQSANFSNANLDSVNLTGATNMSTANVSGVTWINTTCPDGTNSDSNGNTCVGHF